MHALNTASTCVGCCHQRREGTGDGSLLLWWCVLACLCVRLFAYATKCAVIQANIKNAPSSISLFNSSPPSHSPPACIALCNAHFSIILSALPFFVCLFLSLGSAFCLPVCFGVSHLSCMCLVGCDSIEKSPKR